MHNPFLNLSNDEKSMIRLFAGLGEHEKEQLMAYMHNRLDDQIELNKGILGFEPSVNSLRFSAKSLDD